MARSLKAIDQAMREANDVRISSAIASIGEQMGMYDVDRKESQGQIQENVVLFLREAMDAGLQAVTNKMKKLTVPDLKGHKDPAQWGDLYRVFNETFVAQYEANDVEVDVRKRDNYMTKIRQFIVKRGTTVEDLDLFNNFATKAKKAEDKKRGAQLPASGDDASMPVDAEGNAVQVSAHERGAANEVSYQGATALAAFLAKFIDANPKAQASIPFAHLLGAVDDLYAETQEFIQSQTEAKQGKGKGKKKDRVLSIDEII